MKEILVENSSVIARVIPFPGARRSIKMKAVTVPSILKILKGKSSLIVKANLSQGT
jgi:hypothetical protein